jgi:hypothetical protein
MSKYNILVDGGPGGEVWLDALNFEYYFFLSDKICPTPEQRTHIEENYNNMIEDVAFGYCKLANRKGVEKEGYALHRKGPKHDRYTDLFFKIGKLREIANEPLQRIRNFETIVEIENNNGFDYSVTPARCGKTWGQINIDIKYKIYKRAKSIHKKQYLKCVWDYYNIPEKNYLDIMNYIPLENDFVFYREGQDNTKTVVPYTPQTGKLLERIIQGTAKIGDLLSMLFNSLEKLDPKLSFNGMLQLVDKTDEGEPDGIELSNRKGHKGN